MRFVPQSALVIIMPDIGTTGSLSSVSELEGYRTSAGHNTQVQNPKHHAHGGSKCICIETFRFPYANTKIEFHDIIIENSDTPLMLGF